jgi:hypothetical protein
MVVGGIMFTLEIARLRVREWKRGDQAAIWVEWKKELSYSARSKFGVQRITPE